ncbi:MAG: hypothetical protein H6812_12340 [Phycisphaeraceae bacterium]|nr:hypothetical protein [Phycisphaeraceae bacterium]
MSIRTPLMRACGASIGLLALASSAHAGMSPILSPGTYALANHPDGNAATPYYGMRADGLRTGNANDTYTFDFEAPGAAMFTDITDNGGGNYSIRIYGQAFGGRDIGGTYDAVESGMVSIEFTYAVATQVPGDDDFWVTGPDMTNNGTIAFISGALAGEAYALTDKSNGSYSFRLGDEDNDAGHRGHDGISGWGWMNHGPVGGQIGGHLNDTDWLFTVIVPTPGSTALLGFAGLATLRRRR